MNKLVSILEGGVDARRLLEDLVAKNKDEHQYLQSQLMELDRYSSVAEISWWLSLNREREMPNGLIVVKNTAGSSVLQSLWLDIRSEEEMHETLQGLLGTWDSSSTDTTTLVINFIDNFILSNEFEAAGFHFEKDITYRYSTETEITELEDTDSLVLRKPRREELGEIYDELIAPDLDLLSPIYISREEFMVMADRLGEEMENFLLVTSETGILLGFGAAFPQEENVALFGPHSLSSEVEGVIIQEFKTYWKLRGKQKIDIVRTRLLEPSIQEKLNIKFEPDETMKKYVKTRYA